MPLTPPLGANVRSFLWPNVRRVHVAPANRLRHLFRSLFLLILAGWEVPSTSGAVQAQTASVRSGRVEGRASSAIASCAFLTSYGGWTEKP